MKNTLQDRGRSTERAGRNGPACSAWRPLLVAALLLNAAGSVHAEQAGTKPDDALAHELRQSFRAKGPVAMDRLDQDEAQAFCSRFPAARQPAAERERIQTQMTAQIQYPPDGNYLGDWKRGEAIAQTGTGLQSSDDPAKPNGGNCYACHQLSGSELSYGNMGPSLRGYGKLRGTSPEILRYTWGRLWNSQAFHLCSQMPRFGARGILTSAQLRDVMALLFDADSPVNR